MTSPNAYHGSLIRPLINSILWAFSITDIERRQRTLQSCKEYMNSFGLTTRYNDLYTALSQSTNLPILEIREALRQDSLVEIVSQAKVTQLSKRANETETEEPKTDATLSPEDTVEQKETVEQEEIEQVPQVSIESNDAEESNDADQPKAEENLVVGDETEEVPVAEPSEDTTSKPVWNDAIRAKILKLRKHTRKEKQTPLITRRYDFWSENIGLRNLRTLAGIDTDLLERLNEQNIETFADILLLAPKRFTRPPQAQFDSSMPDGQFVIRGKIASKLVRLTEHLESWEVVLENNKRELFIRWNIKPPRGWDSWQIGSFIGFSGMIEVEDDIRVFGAEPIGLAGKGSGYQAEYDLDDIENVDIRDLIAKVIQNISKCIQEPLPKEILDRYKLLSFEEALRDAHFPANGDFKGRQRLGFDEVFLYLIGKRLSKPEGERVKGIAHNILHGDVALLGQIKNIRLTDVQEVVASEIRRALSSHRPMKHLLQGDVGSGKSLIVMLTAIVVAQGGKQVFYIAPNSLDAERRFLFAETLFREIGVSAQLIVGAPNKAQRDALNRGEINIAFGSAELLSSDCSQQSLGLVIFEEGDDSQLHTSLIHKKKNISPDILFFSPYPMSLQRLEEHYFDTTLSIIEKSAFPVSDSIFCLATQRAEIYSQVADEIKLGRQAYIVLPLKEGKDLLSLSDAMSMAGQLQKAYLNDARIGVYSSEMSRIDRLRIFEDFQQRRIDILFCTSHIEDVPSVGNVSCMVVELAEESELMRLHRLRGQLSKSFYASCCYFVLSSTASEEAINKVRTVCQEKNGFQLAEKHAAGNAPYRWIEEDRELRLNARDAMTALSTSDLKQHRWPLLMTAIRGWWGDTFKELPSKRVRKPKKRRYRRKR